MFENMEVGNSNTKIEGKDVVVVKRIQAYFKNENDAESVKAKLQSLNVNNATVEEIPENNDGILDIFRDLIVLDESDKQQLTQVLQFEITEEDYQKANAMVKESDGYISRD
jgi:hypothetical protein